MNYLSPETKKEQKKGGIFSASYSKTNPQNLNYFKIYASELPFRILFQFHHSLCVVLHPPFSYRTQKLFVQFLLKATVCYHSLIHLSVTILSTLELCIHSLQPLAVAAVAHIVPYTSPNVHNYPPPSSVVTTLHH